MTILVVGSTALKALGLCGRKPKDVDIFGDVDPKRVRWDVFWHESLESWWPPGTERMATLDELYTIKLSHAYWELPNGSWNKHMYDLVVLRQAGAKVIQPLHDALYRVWEQHHGAKKVDLNMDSTAFFTDAVRRVWDHDSVHVSVAYGEQPMYEGLRREGEDVGMDMAKVKALPEEDIVKLFREEVYATALERRIIPGEYTYPARAAYYWALRRTITSLTKGWSAQFIAERYEVFRISDMDYVERHRERAHLLVPYGEAQKSAT